MVYKRFGVVVAALVVLLAITIFAFTWTFSHGNLKVTSFNLFVLILLECWYLIYFVGRTNRDLARFFISFRNKDTSLNFEGKPYGKSFQELYNSMNAIVHEYSDIQQEREAQYSFFVSAFQQIPTGILVYNSEGVVKLQNKALLQMLKLGPFLDMHTIDNFRTGFYTFIKSLKTGQSDIIKVRHGENVANISVKVTEFIVRNDSLRLVIFQDVTSELEHAEIESMQKWYVYLPMKS
ncbi:MAG: hypothetical protein HC905_04225 [Bacteroidales bacterium]|nr:hypothetical protein [Bacteroidales bacterium]